MLVIMYSTQWCSDCKSAKQVLRCAHVKYVERDIEEEAGAEEEMMRLNGGSGHVPTLILESPLGSRILIEPEDDELLEALQQLGLTDAKKDAREE